MACVPSVCLAAATFLLIAAQPQLVNACSVAGAQVYELDETEVGVDVQNPEQPAAVNVEIRRGVGPKCRLGSCSETSCDDLGSFNLEIPDGQDDRTPADQLGYQLRVIEGDLPRGLEANAIEGTFGLTDGGIGFTWVDGATDDQEGFGFTLAVSAVDLAGNVGPELEVEVSHRGSSGCSIAGRQSGPWSLGLLLLVSGARVRTRVKSDLPSDLE